MTRRLGGTVRLRLPRTRSKYGAIKTTVDGIVFDSKREATVYAELKLRQRIGEISDLSCHPPFPIVVAGTCVAIYEADFQYLEGQRIVVLDVKGVKTPVYRLKKKLVQALYGISITEVA